MALVSNENYEKHKEVYSQPGFLSIEDLVQNRHSLSVVNPWLSRWVILCKDGNGKIGLRVQTYKKGVFVSLVVPGSPAAMAGLRFGDQLLTLGKTELAGKTPDRVHCMFRSCSVNNIVMAVRDRPLCRSIKLNKVQNSMKKLIINDLYTKEIKFNNNAGSSWKTWNQDQTGRFANRIFA